jgi:hypothetical protein
MAAAGLGLLLGGGCGAVNLVAPEGRQVRILGSDQRSLAASAPKLDLAEIGQREDYVFWSDGLRWIRNPATRAVCVQSQ